MNREKDKLTPQGGQVPPQSVSVSEPFLRPSPQRGAWQTASRQRSLLQSASSRHASPAGQGGHTPPQSRPVSRLLGVWSVQMELRVGSAGVKP